MAVGAVVARILTQYSDKGSKAAQKDINKLGKNFDAFAKKSARAFGIATAASAAFALKIGKDAVQAAIEDQKSQALLANTLRNTTGATESAIAGAENYITSLQKQFSVVDDELRPALGRLTAATGSLSAGQSLLNTALDVSASSGADLATATGAIIKATSGQFKSLKSLVPALSNTTIKSKDVAKAFEEVNKATSGAAAKRAGTLEFRLKGLQIAFGEVLETLGYALLPVIEKFAKVLATDLLPKFEAFINLNKDKLAVGLQKAAQLMLNLFTAAVAFGDWVVNNISTIKTLAVILATMWATSKVYNFAKAVGAVTLAFRGMQIAALGGTAAAAAGGTAAAAAGAIPIAIAAGIAALTFGLSKISPGEKARAKAKTAAKVLGSNFPMSPGATDVAAGVKASSTASLGGKVANKSLADYFNELSKSMGKTTKATKDLLTAKQKELNLKLKELGITTTEQQDAITQMAIIKNLERQASLSGSPTIAIGASGSMPQANGVTVNVYPQGNVLTERDLITSVQNGIERNFYRSFGVGAYDK